MKFADVIPPKAVQLVLGLFALLLVLAFASKAWGDLAVVDKALEWLQTLAGVMVLLWSGKQVATAFTTSSQTRILGATPAIAGALAGGMLLGLGTWAAPAGLGLLGVMEGVVRWKTGGLLTQQAPPESPPAGKQQPSDGTEQNHG